MTSIWIETGIIQPCQVNIIQTTNRLFKDHLTGVLGSFVEQSEKLKLWGRKLVDYIDPFDQVTIMLSTTKDMESKVDLGGIWSLNIKTDEMLQSILSGMVTIMLALHLEGSSDIANQTVSNYYCILRGRVGQTSMPLNVLIRVSLIFQSGETVVSFHVKGVIWQLRKRERIWYPNIRDQVRMLATNSTHVNLTPPYILIWFELRMQRTGTDIARLPVWRFFIFTNQHSKSCTRFISYWKLKEWKAGLTSAGFELKVQRIGTNTLKHSIQQL